ncbi:hypothetical protein [Tenacibaculum ovolyticum]|uniref:hypothetical protein n=1 Tax=Tenacibaculum ovolyticum TaxID=104270 RepID=UPI0007EDEC29|nr:hypothetical protein [Tenacibaculum ovolyticum]
MFRADNNSIYLNDYNIGSFSDNLATIDTSGIMGGHPNAIGGFLDGFLPSGIGSVVGGIASSVGIGPDDWKDVERRFLGYYKNYVVSFKSILDKVKTYEELTDFDRFLEAAKQSYLRSVPHWDSTNSKKGHQLVGESLGKFQKEVRKLIFAKYGATTDFKLVKKNTDSFTYKSIRGYTFKRGSQSSYYEFKAKTVKTSVKPTKDVDNDTPDKIKYSTTDIKSANDDLPKKGSKGDLFLLLGIAFLFKKQILKLFKL